MADKLTPIYAGTRDNFHHADLGSGSGSNIAACAKVIPPAVIFSDKLPYNPATGKGAKIAETDPEKLTDYGLESTIGVPRIILPGYEMCGSSKNQSPEVYAARSLQFNNQLVDALHRFEDENQFGIDLLVLGGYMRLVGEPLLEAYPDKIINVHPAKLSIVTFGGKYYDISSAVDYNQLMKLTRDIPGLTGMQRTFIGDNAVYDAIEARQEYLSSSVIMVDGGIDHGEILVTGPQVVIPQIHRGSLDPDVASQLQNELKFKSDHPALATALEFIADGRLALGTEKPHYNEWRRVYLDNQPLLYHGFKL